METKYDALVRFFLDNVLCNNICILHLFRYIIKNINEIFYFVDKKSSISCYSHA